MAGNSPIPVALFSNTVARGGAEEHMLTLLRALDRKLFRLHLICTPHVIEMLRADLPADVALFPLEYRKPTQVGSAFSLARYLRKNRIAILHSHLFYSSLFASPVARAAGVPVIVETPHVREHWRHGWKANYAIDRMVGRCVDRYIAVSQANALYLEDEKRIPARKIEVVLNGCDFSRFRAAEKPAAEVRARIGVGSTDPVLIIVGRLEPQKGHAVMLDAMPALLREFPKLRLVCLGEGSLRPDLEKRASELGVGASVNFLGFQSDVADWLNMADLAVLPSFYEGLPLVALETLFMGRTMVASAVDGTPEIVVDGRTGVTVPPGEPAALAEAIGRLLRDPALARRYGEAGHAWVQERFTQDQQIERTQQLYLRELASKGAIAPQACAAAEMKVAG